MSAGQGPRDDEGFSEFLEDDDYKLERGRSGLLGKLANARGVALIVIVGLVALSVGAVGLIASLL